jgi:hypothetical protein
MFLLKKLDKKQKICGFAQRPNINFIKPALSPSLAKSPGLTPTGLP